MTYYWNHNTTETYSFTAFAGKSLFGDGRADCGNSFKMPGCASVRIDVSDNDNSLSGDSSCNERADDHSGQTARIDGAGGEQGNGGQIYAESYFWVSDKHGKWYLMIEIEQEGGNGSYYTFHDDYGRPSAGADLTVRSECNVTGDWIKFDKLDAGECEKPAKISGRLFVDADGDNTEWNADSHSWEDGFDGSKVELLDKHGNVVATTQTDAQGNYSFEGVSAGVYSVRFEEPEGYDFVQKDVGNSRDDSDADQSTGRTISFCVSAGDCVTNVDAGIKEATGTITGTVFCDTDCDGLSQTTTTVPGDTYTIEAEDMQKCGFKTVDGAEASGGQLVKLATTGYYGWDGYLRSHFSGKDGTYDIKLRLQDENDGQSKIYVKIGGCLVEAIRLDGDGDGSGNDDDGFSTYVIEDVKVGNGDEILLIADGNCAEYVRIDKIDFVGEDKTETVEEPVKEGVTIKLIDASGSVVATTTTDANGTYTFDDVPAGDYTIMGVAPDGTHFTIQDVGNNAKDDIDSDVNGDGVSGVVTVTGGSKSDIDLGVCEKVQAEPGSLSGRYFCDTNDNDQDDGQATDPGIAGVRVALLSAGTEIAFTFTDAQGNYAFAGLEPGSYGVEFTDPDGVLAGKTLVTPNVGPDATDSDAIGNTTLSSIENIEVEPGQDTPDNDAGAEYLLGAIGDKVFLDRDRDGIQDAGEEGVAGVQVTLTGAGTDGVFGTADDTTATTTTDADGLYLFDNLRAGDFIVSFLEPDAFDFTLQDQGGDDAVDSDVDPVTGETGVISLAPGATDLTWDAGLVSENPDAMDDTAKTCADETVTVDVLANDTDDQALTITAVGGTAITEGGSVDVDGLTISLVGGELVVDGTAKYADLLIGDQASDSFSYSVSDGLGGTDTAQVEVSFCGAKNTDGTISESFGSLSGDFAVGGYFTGDAYTAFTLNTGDARFDNVVFDEAYCLERSATIKSGTIISAEIYVGTEEGIPDGLFSDSVIDNLDLINWIVNQDFGSQDNGDGNGRTYSDAEIQGAIWGLTDGDARVAGRSGTDNGVYNGTNANAREIRDLALANGEGFEAGEGDLITFVIDPDEVQDGVSEANDHDQAFLISLPFDSFSQDCLCG